MGAKLSLEDAIFISELFHKSSEAFYLGLVLSKSLLHAILHLVKLFSDT